MAEVVRGIGVRDSKDKKGSVLIFTASVWTEFVTLVGDAAT
ncbi:DUF397 domain-containing protein [Streptomyces sp. NPDC002402]